MDTPLTQGRQRSYSRAPSRSSTRTSTSTSRVTSNSANSSSSQIALSPPRSQSHCSHRYNQTQLSVGSPRSMSRPTPPLSGRESAESPRQHAVSSFLQEKLQRERRAESEKLSQMQTSASKSDPDLCPMGELGRAQGSPSKSLAPEGNRSQSIEAKQGNKKGLGVKEMEQVISTLHKQNFDLKLELYHRRERQTEMEKRLDILERENQQAEAVNDKLLVELEKRDKAVEEAVAMIVTLEAKVDQLIRERSMVQQVDSKLFFDPRNHDAGFQTPCPQGFGPDIARMEDEAKTVNRMPSFVSDHSGLTENLRDVYLGARASTMHFPGLGGSSPDADNIQALGSPTLSVLSESSFASVYGRKNQTADEDDNRTLVLGAAESLSRNGVEASLPRRAKARSVSSSRTDCSRASSAGRYPSITDVITASPLQRLELLDTAHGNHLMRSTPVPEKCSTSSSMARQDDRSSLRRVLSDGAGGVRLQDHGLPPTPDTISSSTLPRLESSKDVMSRKFDRSQDGSHGVSLHSTEPDAVLQSSCGSPSGAEHGREFDSWAATDSRSTTGSIFKQDAAFSARPRSADESTISFGRRSRRWSSGAEGDEDNRSDAHSLQSSLDIWMREGVQPSIKKGRESPDLFSFPSSSHKRDWTVDALLGAGSMPSNSASRSSGFDYMRDLFSLRQGLFSDTAPPPPPNRRSSLHARTGSSEATSNSVGGQPDDLDGSSASTKRRSYQSRHDSVGVDGRDSMRTPVQRDQFEAPPHSSSDQKSKQYPPISGQQNGTARTGLNRLFRRSVGNTSAVQVLVQPTNKLNGPETAKNQPARASRLCAEEDDRSGATPPPISLNPRQARRSSMGLDGEPGGPAAQELDTSKAPAPAAAAVAAAVTADQEPIAAENSPAAPSGMGIRRKWLPGLSRAMNSKNKSG